MDNCVRNIQSVAELSKQVFDSNQSIWQRAGSGIIEILETTAGFGICRSNLLMQKWTYTWVVRLLKSCRSVE